MTLFEAFKVVIQVIVLVVLYMVLVAFLYLPIAIAESVQNLWFLLLYIVIIPVDITLFTWIFNGE